MGQFSPPGNLVLPVGGLTVASEAVLVRRSMGGIIRQVAGTTSPRSSGRPPPLLSSFGINGGGESARLIVPFGVKYQKYDVEKCLYVSNRRDVRAMASEVKMDKINFPKNFVLSRDNIHAIYDAFSAGRSVSEAAAEVVQATSSKKVSRPPAQASPQASKPSSRSTKSSSRSTGTKTSSTSRPAEGSRSAPTFSEVVKETPLAVVEQTQSADQVEQGAAHSPERVSGGKSKSPVNKNQEASGTGQEIVLIEDPSPEVLTQDASAPVRTEPEGFEGVPPKTGDKRPAPSGESAPSPARKKSRSATGSSPALPPIGKGKGVAAEPPLPSFGNVLKASDITSESPANAVADLLREQMFGGVTHASDPRLIALTGLLASSTKEQASFRSRSHEELGSLIREMLLMVTGLFMEVDARNRSLRESVDRRIEEARLEENISATNDARGNLAEEKEAEAAKRTSFLEDELSRTRNVLKESGERAAPLEIRCEEVLKQLSSMMEALRERDEAVSQKAEAQRQYDALKADFEGLQTRLKEVESQRETALARVQVLEQELSTSSDRIRDLASSAEKFKFHYNQLSQEVRALERKCLALFEVIKHSESKAQLVREQCIAEYQESAEMKVKIEQASEACEAHLDRYLASDEMKSTIVNKALRYYSSGYNRGLREARQAPDT
ncbi:MAP7 domain-containing protein 1-like [Manihot esculenta]|uniref:MAP7 domain-containing protein 1-like n=1 Tax=Manihot esculenta TaxID=3983 RepID=UPI001CC4D4B8|nr:MAP7 domain-containing protein 1-like [Manihot esculenta]